MCSHACVSGVKINCIMSKNAIIMQLGQCFTAVQYIYCCSNVFCRRSDNTVKVFLPCLKFPAAALEAVGFQIKAGIQW